MRDCFESKTQSWRKNAICLRRFALSRSETPRGFLPAESRERTRTPGTIPSVSTKTGHLPSPANSENAWSGRGSLTAGIRRSRYDLTEKFTIFQNLYLHPGMKANKRRRHHPLYQYTKIMYSGVGRFLVARSFRWFRCRRNHSGESHRLVAG